MLNNNVRNIKSIMAKKDKEYLKDATAIIGEVIEANKQTGFLCLKFKNKTYECYIEEGGEVKMPKLGEYLMLICKPSPNNSNT